MVYAKGRGEKASMDTVEKGDWSEQRVLNTLLKLGFRDVRATKRRSPYDLEVDARPVEVKYSSGGKRGWHFHLHRYRGGDPYPVIGYVFCLDNVPGETDWVFLVIPGPLSGDGFHTSQRLLKGAHRHLISNWQTLQLEPYPLNPLPPPGTMPKIKAKDVPLFIEYGMHYSGLSLSKFAKRMRIPIEGIQDVLDGNVQPSEELLHAIEGSIT
jgi:hypothetical protein